MKTINDYQPIIDVDRDTDILLGRNGELTQGFRIKLCPVFTQDLTYFNELNRNLANILLSLPDNYRIHKQDFFTLHRIQLKADNYIEKQRANMFANHKLIRQESFIYLTSIPASLHDASLVRFSSFSSVQTSKAGVNSIRNFKEAVYAFRSQFESIMKKEKEFDNFYLKQLSWQDFLEAPSAGHYGVLAKYIYLCQNYYSDITWDKISNDLKIGDNYVDIVSISSLEDLPLAISPVKPYKPYSTDTTKLYLSLMANVGPFLKFDHIINTVICKGNSNKEKKKLETKGTVLGNFSGTSRENRQANEDIESFLEEVTKKNSDIVDCHFNIITWDCEKTALFSKKSEIINRLKNLNFIPKSETLNKANLFFANIPGNVINIYKEFRFKTTNEIATSFFNLDDLQVDTQLKAGIQVTDRFTGAPLTIDVDDYAMQAGFVDNFNKFVIGSSGGGKSVTMNYYTMCNLKMGTHVIIIDMGKSYQGISDYFGGVWFEYTAEHPLTFNPFILYKFDYVAERLSLMKSTTLISIIKLLWKGPDGIFSESESTTIERTLDAYYQSKPARYCFDTFFEFTIGPNSPVHLANNFPVKDFKYVLEQYYSGGKYEHLLNAPEGIDLLNSQLIVFEIGGMKESKLFPVLTCLIIDTILTKLHHLPDVRKQILQDEAWKALATPVMENFFLELVKTIRKLDGILIFITQEIEDLISSPIIKNSILNNCSTKILLSQNQFIKRFDLIQSILGITDHEKDLVFSLNRDKHDDSRDILILYNNGPAQVYSIKLSPVEYLICTSKKEEKEGILKVAEYLKSSYFEAIKFIVDHLSDKISAEIKKENSAGKKISYSIAVGRVLEKL